MVNSRFQRCFHRVKKPCARKGPMPFGRPLGEPKNLPGLLQGEPGEKPQLDDLRGLRFFLGELFQRFVDEQQGVIVSICGNVNAIQIDSFPATTALAGGLAASTVNEDAAHGFGGRRKKMGAIGELHIRFVAR